MEIGLSKHTDLIVTNITDQNLTLYFNFDSSTSDFAWLPVPLKRIAISPMSSINLDIAFIPGSVGQKIATLTISDGSPFNSSLVKFSGTGKEKKPEVSIEDVIEFFDSAVSFGDIVGNEIGSTSTSYNLKNVGEGNEVAKSSNSGQNRLKAFRNMILSTADKIQEESLVGACQQLNELYDKTDGQNPPISAPDFIYGTSKQELARMIADLRQQIGCK